MRTKSPIPKPAIPRPALRSLAAVAVLALAGCAAPGQSASPADSASPGSSATAVPHGYVEGATEETEPQLHLATIDGASTLTLLDLLSEETTTIGTLDDVTSVSTDGRYVFASSASAGELSIVDTGVWTVDHEDHSHYYRATAAEVGTIKGAGGATVHTGGGLTAVYFAESGEGVILDHAALGDGEISKLGEISELGTIDGTPHAGVLVPFGGVILGTEAESSSIRAYSPDGKPLDGIETECVGFSGTITTNVGAVFGCTDGAVLATTSADASISFERIPYPAGTTIEPATAFASRPGRPTVAGVSGTSGAWLLDTRERTFTHLPTEVPLLRAVAADDRDGNVVALATDGRILVLDPTTGATVAASEPLLAATIEAAATDPAILDGVDITVDASRAYVNAVAEGVIYEIDYAGGARVARSFAAPGIPLFMVETGR